MIYYKWFYESIYKMNYYYVACNNQKDFIKTIKKHYGVDIEYHDGGYAKFTAITTKENKVVSAIWVKSRTAHEYFAHELIHSLIYLFTYINHPFTAENDEPIAYLAEYLTSQFIDKKDWKVFPKVRKRK